VVAKGGALNIQLMKVENKNKRLFKDIFNTLIDAPWR